MKPRLFIALPQFARDPDNINSLADDFSITTARARETSIEELAGLKRPFEALLIGYRERIDEALLHRCQGLGAIGSLTTGTDHVDLSACRRRGIAVVTAGGTNAYAVAEHILMMMLTLRKQALPGHQACLAGDDRTGLSGQPRELRGSRIGILGAGASARHLIALLEPFKAQIAVWARDPDRHSDLAGRVEFASLEALFQTSDLVSLNLALNGETAKTITPAHILSLPVGAILVNCARLELLDRLDLAKALAQRSDVQVGIDATCLNSSHLLPVINNRALFSPHIAGVTEEASKAMNRHVIQGLKACFCKSD